MARKISGIAILIAIIFTSGVAVGTQWEESHLPACATEDSDSCHWDAETQGNGQGRSFDVVNGVVSYTEGN